MNKLPRLAALFLACAVTATAAPTPPPDKLLPADTLAVLTLPDYASVRKASRQNPARQLWDDPAMKPFKDKFMAKFQSDLVKPLEKEFGLKFADYSGLAQGQVTLALTPGEWDGENDAGPGLPPAPRRPRQIRSTQDQPQRHQTEMDRRRQETQDRQDS